jgi:hypothetical protein
VSKSARRRRKQAQAKKKKVQSNTTTQTAGKQTPKAGQKRSGQDRTLKGALLNWPSTLVLTGLLSVVVAIYIGWQIANLQGWGRGVAWGAIAGASIWGAFYASYRFNRWMRQR